MKYLEKYMNLQEKILQMFILGFSGKELNEENQNIQQAIKEGLGGVILFSENIESYEQIANLTTELKKLASVPLFVSIDQEGGRVERTINIKNKINYLTPHALAETGNPDNARAQAEIMVKELKSMGINMDFAPVLDVNTNPNNPIIGLVFTSSNPQTVIGFAKPVYETFINNNIIPVVKHFPGHGDTGEDSHLTMPQVNLSFEELEKQHIEPFKVAFKDGVNAVMISHVHYKAFEETVLPASLSQNIIKHYLRGKLGFQGIVISDDMVMGGIDNYYDSFEACVKGIEAGIDVFIFRNSNDAILNLVHKLVKHVESGLLSRERIDDSVKRILRIKNLEFL